MYNNNKKFSLLGKSSGLSPLASNPDIGTWYSGLCGEGCCPSCKKAWWGDTAEEVFLFLFSTFLDFLGHPLQVGALKWSHQMTGL
jgi:hypothetical protein